MPTLPSIMIVQVLVFELFKELYETKLNFKNIYREALIDYKVDNILMDEFLFQTL